MDEVFIKIENSEMFRTMDNLTHNTDGNIMIKVEFEPSFQTSSECENVYNIKEELNKSSEVLSTGHSLHLAEAIPTDSELSFKKMNKIVNNNCLKNSLLQTEDQKKKHKIRLICDICHRTFANKKGIKIHMSKFHRTVKCIFCPQTFGTEQSQKKHILFTHMEKKITCSLCPKKFPCMEYLNRHMHLHENGKLAELSKTSKNIMVYKCEICHRNYYDIHIFKRHKGIHRKKPIREVQLLKCDVCDEIFTHSRYLISHKRIHDDNTPSFECDICKKKFARKGSLPRHIESHTDQKKYACQLCPRSYKLSKGLTRHMHQHNPFNQDIKSKYVMNSYGKYECGECKKILSTTGTLRRHLLSHSGNKKNACPFCEKKFSRKDDLVTHIRIHTGEKPFSCSKCSETFAHLGNKKKHVKNNH